MRKLIVALAILVTFVTATPAAQAAHDGSGGPHSDKHWSPARRVVHVENRINAQWDQITVQAEQSWGGPLTTGPYAGQDLTTVIDLWGLPYSQRTGEGCDPAPNRIIICYNPTPAGGYAAAPGWADASWHFTACAVHLSYNAAYDMAAWLHELGHCLGLGHGGTGIMNGAGVIDQHDRDAVAWSQVYGGPGHYH